MRGKALAAVVVLAIAGMSGCGGSKPLTRAQFVSQVSAVCQRGHARVQAVFKDVKSQPPATTRARWFTALRAMSKELDRVDAPEALRSPYAAYVGALRAQFAIMMNGDAPHNPADARRQEDANHTATRLAAQMHLGRYC